MKKGLSVFLALLLLLPVFAAGEETEPERFKCEGYTYVLLEDGSAEITNTSRYMSGDIVIPEELNGHKVSVIGEEAFRERKTMYAVTIPEGVVSIKPEAFTACTSLKTVSIPSSVRSIGKYAFLNCKELREVDLPQGVTRIEDATFYSCESLERIMIPDSVTYIDRAAFQSCYHLTSVTIPAGVTSIRENTFYGCHSLSEIVIPEGVTSIGDLAFYACPELTEIRIPDSVTYIGESAFGKCEKLALITLPNGGEVEIGENAFKGTAYARAAEEMIPESFEGAEDYRDTGWTVPEGKKVYTASAYLYSVLPQNIRTLDTAGADYILAKNIRTESREDYTGSAHNTITEVFLCGRDGSVALLCSISHAPPGAGRVKIGQSLGGRQATDEELWEEIRGYFP